MENLILLIILSALGILIYFGVQQTKKTRQQMMDELDELEDTIYGNLPESNPTVSAATAVKTEEKVKTEPTVSAATAVKTEEKVKTEPTVSAATAVKTEEKVTEAAKPKKYYKKKGRPAKPKN